jgi:hypothetical protein
MTETEERVILTADDAIAMLACGDAIHVLSNLVGGVFIGAHWDRAEAIDFIRAASEVEESGKVAAGMGYGVFASGPKGQFYFATKGGAA